jgi:3-methylcrotonyl-CoA carboxylase alpha subunit
VKRILIANRGEIALRVMRTAKRMGLSTVAVYSEADAADAFVEAADQAVLIGPPPARDSYLKVDAIIKAAKQAGADAIHPGYGFLSENAAFADACQREGLIFIGPPAAAIRAMGSKSAAKALMQKAGVPLVPGYHGEDQSEATLDKEAAKVGFPLLIKASAGGGGKGMKIAAAKGEFKDALASAQREAQNAFGDAKVLLERYLTKPRHVEMQIFADSHGNVLHLFERDCSLQRRYQKVVEEAPAPFLADAMRQAMAAAAVAAARAVDYVGAGTVEFIVEGDQFYFMEMNTRLQVEHPVTEAITGLDLVEWQIRVARGENLPLSQEQVEKQGHAVEVRLYAEDPDRDFLPQIGRLCHLAWPGGVRIDSGVRQGSEVSRHYDPMLAKLVAHGADRNEAIGRLVRALEHTEIVGVATNRRFLRKLVGHPDFAAGEIDTGFIARHSADLQSAQAGDLLIAAGMLAVLKRAEKVTADPADPHSPWGQLPGWRINRDAYVDVELDGNTFRAHYKKRGFQFDLSKPTEIAGDDATLVIDGRRLSYTAVFDGLTLTIFADGEEARFQLADPNRAAAGEGGAGKLVAPMPGQVTKLFVKEGDKVEKGAPLIVIEAMKMEHTINAPREGTIVKLPFAVGDIVPEAAELLVLE